MESRTCTKCKESFPATTEYFYARKRGEGSLYGRCKSCQADHNRGKARNRKEEKLRDATFDWCWLNGNDEVYCL